MEASDNDRPVILFDGVCVLCSGTVKFIIHRDKKALFRFAALQSKAGQKMIDGFKGFSENPDTVVLIENGKFYFRSAAVLRILRKLSGGWPLLYAMIIIPAPVRDFFYKFVAKKRYGWFGRYQECVIPEDNIRNRFLDMQDTDIE